MAVGLSAGGVGTAMGWLMNHGFKEETAFSFLGAVVGAAATVAGAVWVADRTATAASVKEKSILLKECETILTLTSRSLDIWNSDKAPTGAFRTSIHSLQRAALEAPAIFREALARSTTLDFRQRVKLIKAEAGILSFQRFYSDVFSDFELDPQEERDWPSTLSYLLECVNEARRDLEKA